MSIRLDWEIEAEQEHLRGATEDPDIKRRRRRTQLLFIVLVLLLLLVVGGIIGGISLRLRFVDWQVEQLLRDTVDAEIATLRIGDEGAYLTMQRSATEAWYQYQRTIFADYQILKALPNTSLEGEISAVMIDGTRGRVQVREIINGVEIERVWFYWRYEDGWRHVPPDTTFWGDERTLETEFVTVSFQALDEPFARAVLDQVTNWVTTGCQILTCDARPPITIVITLTEPLAIGWVDDASWTMRLPSPYLDRMFVATPFSSTTQIAVADALADRLFTISADNDAAVYPADAYYLRQAVVSWMVGRLTGARTNSFLMESIARNYGEFSIGRLVNALQPASSIAILNDVLAAPSLDAANLDWRDVLTWRLALEGELIDRGAQAEFVALYDPAASALALARFNSNVRADGWVVTEVQPDIDTAGVPRLRVQADANGAAQEVIFQLAEGVWKRAS